MAPPNEGTAVIDRDGSRSDDDVLFIKMAVVLLRQRMTLVWTILFFASISVVIALTKPTLFSSSARFLPESSGGGRVPSGAMALAQQFGVALGSGGNDRSPQFYAGLITSDQILRQVVTRRFPLTPAEGSPAEADLMSHYEVRGDTEEERIERAILSLRDDIGVGTEFETGIVGFSVTTTDPLLSMEIAQLILELVNEFDLATRQSQASAERVFVEGRLRQLNHELVEAEDNLKEFLLANRSYEASPELRFEHDRLQRAVGMHQELVTSLLQAYESARIEEVRNTPVIAVLEAPRIPAVRDPKGRIMIGIMGLLVGGMFGVVLAFLKHYVEEDRRRDNPRLSELSTTWRAAFGRRSKHSVGSIAD